MGKLRSAVKGLDGLADKVSELVRLGYPESTAKKIASGELPMDQASRMARAREQGFDVDQTLYHGTSADFVDARGSKSGEFGRGFYSTDSPKEAGGYASIPREGDSGPSIYPVVSRGEKFDASDADFWERFMRDGMDDNDVVDAAIDQGYDGVVKDRPYSWYDDAESQFKQDGTRITHVNTFDPSNIRSTNAAFDPDQKDSANLLAGGAAAAVGLGAATQSNESSAMALAANEFQQRRESTRGQWEAMRADLLDSVSKAAEFTFDSIDVPWKGILGLTRTAGGLASGEGFDQALNAGVQQIRQPLEQTADQLGGTMTDATGSPLAGTAVNVGINMGGPI